MADRNQRTMGSYKKQWTAGQLFRSCHLYQWATLDIPAMDQ